MVDGGGGAGDGIFPGPLWWLADSGKAGNGRASSCLERRGAWWPAGGGPGHALPRAARGAAGPGFLLVWRV